MNKILLIKMNKGDKKWTGNQIEMIKNQYINK